jgi:cytoskeletal protein CcmA (bactofilin family)
MRMPIEFRRLRILALVFGIVLYGAIAPGVVAGQSGASGSVVVGPDETISSIDAITGSIVVEGTVTGDISGVAGDVRIDGVVEGNVELASGDVDIYGDVGGDVSVGAGNVRIHDGAVIDGDFSTGAGIVVVDGTIAGDARIGAETIRLGEQASIGGSLAYDGTLEGDVDAVVAGDVTRDRSLSVGLIDDLQPFIEWVFTVNIFLLNLLFGAILIGLFPQFSDTVARRVQTSPIRSGLLGLGVVIAVPLLLLAIAITVVGLPISLVGAFLFALVLWVGVLYGRFALGVWLLSLLDVHSRWGGLLLGVLVGTLLWQIPVLGGLLNLLIALFGIGALVSGLVSRRRRIDDNPATKMAPTD